MIRTYVDFAARQWQPLLFGALIIGLSGFGQAYFISLFGGRFRETFTLTDGELGTIYALATLLAALTLPLLGPLIDRTTVRRYAWRVAIALAGACLLVALSPTAFVLAAGFYALRLTGQGLMVHTAVTATARALPADGGKALGLVVLGSTVAQAVLPVLAVSIMERIGWRWTWGLSAGVVLFGAWVALAYLPREAVKRETTGHRMEGLARSRGLSIWRDPRLLVPLPALLAVSFILSGFLFHQARLVAEKGWSLAWLAGWFVAYAGAQALANRFAERTEGT